jgi:hypothetical protein
MQIHVRALPQPQFCACWNPSTDSPIPAATRTAPVQSIASGRRTSVTCARASRISAITAIGMLIQKIDRHVHCDR